MLSLPFLALASLAPASSPQEVDLLAEVFGGVALGDSVEAVTAKIDGLYATLERHDVAPYLPLAAKTQTHLVVLDLPPAGVEEVAFTFGDDALVMVEARGGAIESWLPALEGTEPLELAGLRVWPELGVVADPERDLVRILGDEALHVNLFAWDNPDLPSVPPLEATYPRTAKRPAALTFGGSYKALLPELRQASRFLSEQSITPPWLPTAPRLQVQVDAFGVVWGGFPRKVEAVFGDGRLQLAWILTGKQEEGRVRADLVSAFGKPCFVSDQWEAFDGFRVALRKDKPEVLMIADELLADYRARIEASAEEK